MVITAILNKAGRQVIDLLFPPRCAVCGSLEAFLCDRCAASLPVASLPRCPVCWQPTADGECRKCQKAPPAFAALRCPYVFKEGVREVVHGLKYQHQSVLAAPMAELLHRFLADNPLPADVIVPVPLFPRRRRVRGYNQSALLAHALARHLRLPVDERTLARTRNTASQARTGKADERKFNVREAFACRGDALTGKTVLLLDDVTTTGATLDACAHALREAGVASVRALTFARED